MASIEHLRCDICNILKPMTMIFMWRKLARDGGKKAPRNVPPRHLTVTVGEAARRFVIRTDYLNHSVFKELLDQAYEEYGHNKNGSLAIPCDELLFQDIIHSLRGGTYVGWFSFPVTEQMMGLSSWMDSRPFLDGFARRSAS